MMAVLAAGGLCAAGILACGDDGDDPAGPPLDAAAQRGREVARNNGCTGCHTADGTASTGPTFHELWGSTVELDDGTTAVVDADYVERSIREPGSQVVEGYNPVMPEFDLSDDEIAAVVAYLRALA